MSIHCNDCIYYLPVDVFSGICKLSKNNILPDDPGCDQSERIARCKFCTHYTQERDYLGKCQGSVMAYPDMNASKCNDFQWISPN